MLIPPQKTTKTMNKLLRTDENSSGRTPQYNIEAAETQRHTKTEDGHVDNHSKHFTCIALSPGLAHLGADRDPLA